MKVSLVPSWFHKASAFATAAVASAAVWPWEQIVAPETAVQIVSVLAFLKLTVEFFTRDARTEKDG